MQTLRILATAALFSLASVTIAQTATPRIVGGAPLSNEDTWPWMTQLMILDPDSPGQYLLCGASQLSPRWVLTAAHCLEYSSGSPVSKENVFVFIGEEARNNDPNDGIRAEQLLIHPGYDSSQGDYTHDLGLIRIPATGNSAWPSIISTDLNDDLELAPFSERDESMTALGWGQTENGSLSSILLKVQLDYIPLPQCQNLTTLPINAFIVCAAELNPTTQPQDTCFGDSGGPLFLGSEPSPWLTGITSFGEAIGCAAGGPGGYTRVAAETDALEDLTASAGFPLVDLELSWQEAAPPPRYYLPPSGSIKLSLTAANSGKNTINNPTLTPTLSGGTIASVQWESCSTGLFDEDCNPAGALATQTSLTEALIVDGNSGPNQAVTLTVTGTANEDDYRQRTNQLTQDIIFSSNPDIALTASQISSTSSVASARVTLKNLSTLNAASGGRVSFTLPTGMKLVNEDELACQGTSPTICQLGNLPPDSQASLVLQVTGAPDSSRDLFFQGQINETDFPAGDSSASLTVRFASLPVPESSSGGTLWLCSLLPMLALALRRRPCSPP